MHSKRRRKTISIVTTVFAFIGFFVIFSFAVVWANGLVIDFEQRRIEQTSVLAVEGQDTNLRIYLNEKLVGDSLPLQLRNLNDGIVTLRIEKEGYHTIIKTLSLVLGRASVVEGVKMVAKSPAIKTLPPNTAPRYLVEPNFDFGISLVGSEVYLSGNLVTRLSAVPVSFKRFNQGFIYQVGDRLQYFQPSTNLDVTIYQLPSAEIAKLNLSERDSLIYLFLEDTVKEISIFSSSENVAESR